MRGLVAVAWAAIGSAVAGSAGIALIPGWLSAPPLRGAVGGATFATLVGDRQGRLVVTSLRTAGPEAVAGLRVGDVVAAVNGTSAPSLRTLRREEAQRGPVSLVVDRRGAPLTLTLLHPDQGGR